MKLFKDKYSLTLLILTIGLNQLQSQIIEADPVYPTIQDAVDITLYTDRCECPLEEHTGDIYAHTGVLTENGSGIWEYVIAGWNENIEKAKLEKTGDNTYVLHISPSINEYYGIPDTVAVEQLAFVFRNEEGTQQSGNLFYDVQNEGLAV